ncbi:uncharacterized protein VTP21DRAFT_10546 [Calcarisporiella thermophila]|uniref:uncharacterized protein n=1 Tax=Calcarisporiella thermophila TaxID=911321 RepID=UPI003742D45D
MIKKGLKFGGARHDDYQNDPLRRPRPVSSEYLESDQMRPSPERTPSSASLQVAAEARQRQLERHYLGGPSSPTSPSNYSPTLPLPNAYSSPSDQYNAYSPSEQAGRYSPSSGQAIAYSPSDEDNIYSPSSREPHEYYTSAKDNTYSQQSIPDEYRASDVYKASGYVSTHFELNYPSYYDTRQSNAYTYGDENSVHDSKIYKQSWSHVRGSVYPQNRDSEYYDDSLVHGGRGSAYYASSMGDAYEPTDSVIYEDRHQDAGQYRDSMVSRSWDDRYSNDFPQKGDLDKQSAKSSGWRPPVDSWDRNPPSQYPITNNKPREKAQPPSVSVPSISITPSPMNKITAPSSQQPRSPSSPNKSGPSSRKTPANAADDFVTQGIQFHENGQLEKATHYFRMASEQGSPVGMLFYGMSLRHGWGCKPNAHLAFQFLQRAAECAASDLNSLHSVNKSAAKGELVMAIYELGVSFRHGWGVPKNKATAAYYFEIAANLGDPDAQNDLGFAYEHGLGVKSDKFKAAKYYRMAEKQGRGQVGNSWIWKSKYDVVGV